MEEIGNVLFVPLLTALTGTTARGIQGNILVAKVKWLDCLKLRVKTTYD